MLNGQFAAAGVNGERSMKKRLTQGGQALR
jgi:hypothetical protein